MGGTKAALETALAAEEQPVETEQLELLGAPVNEKVVEVRTGRRGRPPGSRNKRTTDLAQYLMSRYTSAAEVLAQIMTAPVAELSASLGCTKLEALQEKRLAAIALAPYMHAKMPVAVDLTNHKMIHLTINEGSADLTAGNDDDDVLTLTATVLSSIESG